MIISKDEAGYAYNIPRKYIEEETLIESVLQKCTAETYVKTINVIIPKGTEEFQSVDLVYKVIHHKLPSGHHVYTRMDCGFEAPGFNEKEPYTAKGRFSKRVLSPSGAKTIIVPNEIDEKDLKVIVMSERVRVGDQAKIVYECHCEERSHESHIHYGYEDIDIYMEYEKEINPDKWEYNEVIRGRKKDFEPELDYDHSQEDGSCEFIYKDGEGYWIPDNWGNENSDGKIIIKSLDTQRSIVDRVKKDIELLRPEKRQVYSDKFDELFSIFKLLKQKPHISGNKRDDWLNGGIVFRQVRTVNDSNSSTVSAFGYKEAGKGENPEGDRI